MPFTKEITHHPLKILLTNGRFPVTLDLARQLKLAGHTVYVVDPMHYHVCKFSKDVKSSFQVPAPHHDPDGYIQGVKEAIHTARIDLIIPMHEEIFCLSDIARSEKDISDRFYSHLLSRHFYDFITNMNSTKVEKLDHTKEWALKPVYGRAALNVFHLEPSKPLPHYGVNGVEVNDDIHYIAQEWVKGDRYCSYTVLQDGEIVALGVYPVEDTIDGSSCVYFESVEHNRIFEYVKSIAKALPGVSGQLALDFVETESTAGTPSRLVAIECNPRATSGIHLWSGSTSLALALTCRKSMRLPPHNLQAFKTFAKPGAKRQVAPGMLMWKRTKGVSNKSAVKEYFSHMKRLVGSRDVVFSFRDIMPTLMEPFLLTTYYEICREKNLKLPTMFQHDLTWEPSGEYLHNIRKLLVIVEDNNPDFHDVQRPAPTSQKLVDP